MSAWPPPQQPPQPPQPGSFPSYPYPPYAPPMMMPPGPPPGPVEPPGPPPPPPMRDPAWPAVVAWLIIFACVGFVAYRVARSYAQSAGKLSTEQEDMQLALTGKTAVGMHALLSGKTGANRNTSTAPSTAPSSSPPISITRTPAPGHRSAAPRATATNPAPTTSPTSGPSVSGGLDPTAQFVDTLERAARTPADQIRAATVIGELRGADAALRRLDDIKLPVTGASTTAPATRAVAAATSPAKSTDKSTDKSTASATDSDDDARSAAAANDPAELARDIAALRKIYTTGPDSLSRAQRDRLIARLDYFGRLALVYGRPDNDPHRKAVIHESIRKSILLYVIGGAFVLMLLAALVLFITGIVLAALGKIHRRYVPQPWANTAYVEAFAIYLVCFLAFGYAMRFVLGANPSLWWEWAAFILVPIVFLWVQGRGIPLFWRRRGFGWYPGRGVLKEIAIGIGGWLAGIPIIALGLFISLQLNKLTGASPTHPIVRMLKEGGCSHVLALYALAAVFAPVVEETMFRGALFNHMRRRWGWWISASLVALIFASIHPQGWTFIPTLGSIAMVLAALREWRGSLIASMAAHATNNFVVLTLGLLITRG